MAKPYNITITNGVGTAPVLNDSYTVSTNTLGYDNTSITPNSVNVEAGVDTYNFTVAATGTLTLHVSETGESTGTSVVGATFIRCDSAGNEYGTEITSTTEGNAVFNNVPFESGGTVNVYYKQKSSDGNHEFDDTLKSIALTESTRTVEVTNTPAAVRTINYTDANYSGLPLESAEITLS